MQTPMALKWNRGICSRKCAKYLYERLGALIPNNYSVFRFVCHSKEYIDKQKLRDRIYPV